MNALTCDIPLPARAGTFRWPGNVVFEPKSAAADAYTVRATRIEFPNGIVFLQVNPALVVVEPVAFTDATMKSQFDLHVANLSKILAKRGLFVITGTAGLRSLHLRGDKRPGDVELAEKLLSEFVLSALTERSADGIKALNAFVVSTPTEEMEAFFTSIAAGFLALPGSLAKDGVDPKKPLHNASDRAFFKHLGMFLEHVNGRFPQVPLPPIVVSLARAELKRKK